jgi:hypothetical protein
MIILLILALAVTAFLFYTCCYSPPAKRVADEMFYDPLEESLRRCGNDEE